MLDEPTAFLDVRYKLELLGILRKLAKERRITVIMSLHELDLAQKVSDLVMCVKGETVTHIGPPQEIFNRELIAGLYGLTGGSYNPLFGSFEMARPAGEPQLFVIAGGGTGIPVFRALQKKGVPFAAGVLHENDADCLLARDLAGEVIAGAGLRADRRGRLRPRAAADEGLRQGGQLPHGLRRNEPEEPGAVRTGPRDGAGDGDGRGPDLRTAQDGGHGPHMPAPMIAGKLAGGFCAILAVRVFSANRAAPAAGELSGAGPV